MQGIATTGTCVVNARTKRSLLLLNSWADTVLVVISPPLDAPTCTARLPRLGQLDDVHRRCVPALPVKRVAKIRTNDSQALLIASIGASREARSAGYQPNNIPTSIENSTAETTAQ
jgi:hypothetical protein